MKKMFVTFATNKMRGINSIHQVVKGKKNWSKLLKQSKKMVKIRNMIALLDQVEVQTGTYCLYLAKKYGLRPLAVHFDNGWNSEISVNNILNATNKLDIDLYTHVVDWESFKDLQIAFLKASVPEADMPTDIAYVATLFQIAVKHDIKYIINGSNYRTEGKQPPAWGYGDGKYIESVYKEFGQKSRLKNIPNYKLLDLAYYTLLKRIRIIKPLYYLEYNKPEAMKIIEKELGWQYYGGHHFENIYTRFIHGYYLPTKFGIDKRIIEYSALIRSNQLSRDEALIKIKEAPYPKERVRSDIEYVMSKLGLQQDEFDEIMASNTHIFADYKTYYPIVIKLRFLINLAYKLKLYPDKVYGKYSYKY